MVPVVLIVDDEAPARARLRTLLGDMQAALPLRIAGEAGNVREALDMVAATSPDIVLLDVQMPGEGGLQLARQLQAQGEHAPLIVFTTAYDQYAVSAFEVDACDYLLKPIRASRLEEALRRACQRRQISLLLTAAPAPAERGFTVSSRGKIYFVPLEQALCVHAEQKYLNLRTSEQTCLLDGSLTTIEQQMGDYFIRIHRNTLVARHAIAGAEKVLHSANDDNAAGEGWQLLIRGLTERYPVSRRQWPQIKALLK